MKNFTKDWFMKALARAVWTFAEVSLGFMTVGAALNEIEWLRMLSVACVAMIISFLKSIMIGIPEGVVDGTLLIDDSGDSTKWLLNVETPIENVSKMKSIRLNVDPNANLCEEKNEE